MTTGVGIIKRPYLSIIHCGVSEAESVIILKAILFTFPGPFFVRAVYMDYIPKVCIRAIA